jgi:hypothetical protein
MMADSGQERWQWPLHEANGNVGSGYEIAY